MPPEGVIIHKIYRTVHRVTDECGAACGIKTNDLMFDFTVDKADLEGCKLCWRAGCAPWEQAGSEKSSSASSASETEKAESDADLDAINFDDL